MNKATEGQAAPVKAQESQTETPETSKAKEQAHKQNGVLTLERRVEELEELVLRIVKKVPLEDAPVKMPAKKNYNPDRLPQFVGNQHVSINDLESMQKE